MSDETPAKSKLGPVIWLVFAVLVVIIAAIAIPDLSRLITYIVGNIKELFYQASMNPSHGKRFNNFVELVLIAVFVGWAASRFKNKG